MKTWADYFKALFYGPGWQPGLPRLGDYDALSDNPERPKHNPIVPSVVEYYFISQFFVLIYVQLMLTVNYAVNILFK